jgi:hypothetical protein
LKFLLSIKKIIAQAGIYLYLQNLPQAFLFQGCLILFIQEERRETLIMKKFTAFAVALLLVAAFCTTSVSAQDFMHNTQGYGAGVWYVSTFGNFADGVNQPVSLRQQLGIRRGWGLNGDAEWQFTDKWGANFNYSRVEMTSTNHVVPTEFTYGAATVAAGQRVDSTINFSTASLMLRYNLYRTPDGTIDFAVAPTLVNYDGTVRRAGTTTAVIDETQNVFIPTVGFSGKQRIAESLHLTGSIVGMGHRDNRLIDFRTDLLYNFQSPGWYATLGYRYYDVRVTPSANRQATQNWNGPLATIRYEF